MKLLALDTSSLACSVAVDLDGATFERHEEQPREHTRLLMPMVRSVLQDAQLQLSDLDAIVIPGGFGERGVEGKIAAAHYAREHGVPCLGLCLGMQVMTIEAARNLLGLAGANSAEFDGETPHPVIDLMDSQRSVTDMGGTMRLGLYPARLKPGSLVADLYGEPIVYERHRHRYEFNNAYRSRLDDVGFVASGVSPDDSLVEFVELRDHPFWVGTQAHPEFTSRPNRASPLFAGLIAAALTRKGAAEEQNGAANTTSTAPRAEVDDSSSQPRSPVPETA
jgi:CTP synthase